MKKQLYFIAILVIVAVTVAVYHSRKTSELTALPQPKELCFTRSVPGTPEAPYAVTESIKLTIDGTKITGTKSGTQSGPDMTNGYEGVLSGTKDGDAATLDYTYTIEGSKQTEEELYVFRDGNLIKKRYPLIEQKNKLVPDTAQWYEEQIYGPAYCPTQ